MQPFTLDIPQAALDDLSQRLGNTRWPDELGDDYGLPFSRVKALAEHWQDGYDWRKHEAELNAHPQFVTGIDGQRIHFLHVRSSDPDALPLILTHGFPGSIVEFLDVIEPLSREFHLVIPSIPGFGLSGPTRSRGWSAARVARAWASLMASLGYERYGAQGGDWGTAISRALAAHAPQNVVGVHLNYLPTPVPPDAEVSDADRERADQIRQYLANQPGWRTMQGTRPQNVGFLLTDSPVAQLTWLLEPFTQWADPARPIDDDRLLTDVMLYWLTGTAGSAARLHKETPLGPAPCPVPVGVAVLPHDITRPIRSLASQQYDIVHWTEFPRGGHFAALEVPDLFAADVRTFFMRFR
jgi:pimeloyl-ACP methyl ester carboxylesterase